MENIKRGNIYWIERSLVKPEIGSVQLANRPGIIVSNEANNMYSNTFEIVYLTTAPKKDLPTHCAIRSSLEPSTALCEHVTTVSIEQIGNFIGTCTLGEMAQIDACLAVSLALEATLMAKPSKTASTQQKTIDSLKMELANARADLAKSQEDAAKLKTDYEELRKIHEVMKAMKNDGSKAELEEMKTKYAELEAELEEAKAQVPGPATRRKRDDKASEKLAEELAKAKTRAEIFEELYHDLKERMLQR